MAKNGEVLLPHAVVKGTTQLMDSPAAAVLANIGVKPLWLVAGHELAVDLQHDQLFCAACNAHVQDAAVYAAIKVRRSTLRIPTVGTGRGQQARTTVQQSRPLVLL